MPCGRGSSSGPHRRCRTIWPRRASAPSCSSRCWPCCLRRSCPPTWCGRSEEHTSELQSHLNLVCRLLLEIKNQGVYLERCAALLSTWAASFRVIISLFDNPHALLVYISRIRESTLVMSNFTLL